MTMLRRVANDCRIWGGVMYLFDSTSNNPYRYVGQLGYYTHWMDSSLTDLLHLGVRFYEPGVGRFSQVDPAGEGWNWYVYAGNQPAVAVDPSGLKLCYCRIRPILSTKPGHGGRLRVDKSCDIKGIDIVVLPEYGNKRSGAQVPTYDRWVDADGFVINGTEYKMDGSTCVTIKCAQKDCATSKVEIIFECCINLVAKLFHGARCPYQFDWPDYP